MRAKGEGEGVGVGDGEGKGASIRGVAVHGDLTWA